ncbi:hypothetical protein G7Y79_00012g032150 [Physcia stellaris]|nr:hypothetical protein G7Y79_00012g032150 [Physcia stellaris]
MDYVRSFASQIVEDSRRLEVLCRVTEAGTSTNKPSVIPESTFDAISKALETEVQRKEWTARPRTYFILWQIRRIDAMEAFIGQGLNDTSLPYKGRSSLPAALNIGEANQFLQWQDRVVSDIIHLEQGKHVRINDGDTLFEVARKKLGVGSQGETVVDKVISKATGKVYARKRINRKRRWNHDKTHTESRPG